MLIISDIIGSIGVIVHVGKYTTQKMEDGLKNMYTCMQYISHFMKDNNIKSKLILETPAGQGTVLLTNLEEFINFYNSFTKDEKKYIGICLDTAHVWSDGYNIVESLLKIIEKNKKDLLVIHYNNSKMEQNSKVDKHESLFDGKIPPEDLKIFLKHLMNLKSKPVIIMEEPGKEMNKEIEWIKEMLEL